MAYSDFTLQSVTKEFGLTLQIEPLFPGLVPVQPTPWLTELLKRGEGVPLVSEKARSEILVMPILLAVRDLSGGTVSIYSGQNLKIDLDRGLVGECDFILARTPPLPIVQAPIVTIVEAKRDDIELWLGQCVAQMVGVRFFNEKEWKPVSPLYGCVTTGERWQFLRLKDEFLEIDKNRYFIRDLGLILAAFQTMLRETE